MHRWSRRLSIRVIATVALALSGAFQFFPSSAEAAPAFTQAYIRLDRMKAGNVATGATVCAQGATSGGNERKVVVQFPSTYIASTTLANWVVDNGIPAGSTFWPGMTSGSTIAASVSGQTITWNMTVGFTNTTTLYCFHFSGTSTLQTAAAAANSQQAYIETQTSGAVAIDHTDVALANNTDDTITVTAVVPPSFIFTLSAYLDFFTGNLDPLSVVSTNGVTAQVTTNAKGGWIAWAKDQYQGLRSTTANYTIPTAGTVNGAPSALSAGTEGYVMDVDLTTDASGGCTLAIDAEYNGATTSQGGTLSGTYQPIASCTGAAPATANGDVITLIERAAISGATPAGTDYTDTITVVGAGNF